ncbi:MAG: phage holin family protein [Coriobacteriia bacterium]|nr:phage holin family protein [Coriobacteriia bacterium]
MAKKSETPTKFLVRWIITAIAVSFAITLIPCITFNSDNSLMANIFIISMFLALINVTIKPVLKALSLPVTILTLGLFALVLNTAMLYLAAWCATSFFGVGAAITDFGSAFVASILISVATWFINTITAFD